MRGSTYLSPLPLFLFSLPGFNSKPSICWCWVNRTLPYANAASWNGEQRDAADYCSFWRRSRRRWRCVGEAAFCTFNEFNLSGASLLQQLCSRDSLGEVASQSPALPLASPGFQPVQEWCCDCPAGNSTYRTHRETLLKKKKESPASSKKNNKINAYRKMNVHIRWTKM